MKLMEIVGRGADRGIEADWREQMHSRATQPGPQTMTGASAVRGFWIISRQGKRLAGPFTDAEKAEAYKAGHKDKIPADAVVRKM